MNHKFHKFLIKAVKFPTYMYMRAVINYHRHRAPKFPEPFIIISNHNTDFDPVLVNIALRQHSYAVASGHIFRKGFSSWIMRTFLDPIARPKGTTATGTVIEMLKRLKKGQNILLFAEGVKSCNGLTNPILPSTGKLIKKAGCTLVTFRLNGGYFTSPRWAKNPIRRGRIDGAPVGVYSPEQLAGMTPDEINKIIMNDISEDAYAYQESRMYRYRGKDLAEGIETALFMCPKCKRLATIKSKEDRFWCDCGLEGTYDRFGYIHGNFEYTTIRDWDLWEIDELYKRIVPGSDEILLTEPGLELYSIEKGGNPVLADSGDLKIDGNNLYLGSTVFPIRDITDIAIQGCSALIMTVNGRGYFEIPSDSRKFIGRVFLLAVERIRALTQQ